MHSAQRMTILCALVTGIGGLIFGYAIGFVPIYTTFNTYNTDCPKLLSQTACNSVDHASCVWAINTTSSEGACFFSDHKTVNCGVHLTEDLCSASAHCVYEYAHSRCVHTPSWTPVKTGVFASAMIFGGMVGSMAVSPILDKFGRKPSLYATAAVALVSSAAATIARVSGSYSLLIIARVLIGVVSGSTCVVCPMYAEEMAPSEVKHVMVVVFQIGCTSGIFLASLLGIILQPSSFSDSMHMEMRFQVLNGFQWLVSLALIPIALAIPESNAWLNRTEDGCPDESSPLLSPNSPPPKRHGSTMAASSSDSTSVILSAESMKSINEREALVHKEKDEEKAEKEKEEEEKKIAKLHREGEHRSLPIWLIVIVALILSASQQFTGINAVMNYAPNIMTAAGLQPLVGNCLVMAWNFLSSLAAIPFSKRFSPRKLYLVGTFVASLACLLNGIPVYPGLLSGASETVRHVLAGIGIFVFIGAFEIAMGPIFYMLAVELFPGKYKSVGCAYTNMTQFVMNIIVNFGFPVCVVALSGGPSGNQDKGMGLMFILFGVTGLASLPPMIKWLYPAPKENDHHVATTFEAENLAAEAS